MFGGLVVRCLALLLMRVGVWVGGVGGLFGFCIVDASIFVVFVVLVCDKL